MNRHRLDQARRHAARREMAEISRRVEGIEFFLAEPVPLKRLSVSPLAEAFPTRSQGYR